MNLVIQSLKSSLTVLGKDALTPFLQAFKCEKDEDIEKFLYPVALDYEEKGICRTFFIMSEKYPGKILGYFSIGLNVMHFDEEIKIEEAYKGVNIYEKGYRPIYKLYMIGKDDNFKEVFKMDKIFNEVVIPYLKQAQALVGCNLLYIDCEPTLEEYYAKLGFAYYDNAEHGLIRMIRAV